MDVAAVGIRLNDARTRLLTHSDAARYVLHARRLVDAALAAVSA